MNLDIKKTSFLFIIIILIIVLAASYYIYNKDNTVINESEGDNRKISYYDTISIGVYNYDTINPILTKNTDVEYLSRLIFDTLFDVTEDFDITSNLVEEWSYIQYDNSYLIKLKDSIFWHDGEKFNAGDVEFTINTIKELNKDTIYKSNVECIKEVQVIDDTTLRIFLTGNEKYFEYKMVLPIVSKHGYDNELNLLTDKPVGTGRYKIDLINNSGIKLRNEHANTEYISIAFYSKLSKLYTDFSKEKIDVVISNSIEFDKYIGNIGYKYKTIPGRKLTYILLNTNRGILKNREIRQAIDRGIDNKEINYNVFNKRYVESNFPLSFLELPDQYNATYAKDVLIENNWKYKNGFWEKNNTKTFITLLLNNSIPKHKNVANNIKEQLDKIGININIIEAEDYLYSKLLNNNNYDMILVESRQNLAPELQNYFNKTIDFEDILHTESNATDSTKKYDKLIQLYNDEIQCICLYYNSITILYNQDIKGSFNSNWYNILYNIDTWYKTEDNYKKINKI